MKIFNTFIFCIFPFSSINGFQDALTIMDITEDDIIHIEQFMKHKFLRNNTDRKDLSAFYGKYFASSPEEFEFLRGERRIITKISDYLKSCTHFSADETTYDLPNQPEHLLSNIENLSHTHVVLNKLLTAANQNACRKNGGFRFDIKIHQFAAYLRMIAGPLAYNTIQRNLRLSLPSISSTERTIRKSNCHITEGILRTDELWCYLNKRNLPLMVSLSEDATRINGRIQYDSQTNQVLGFPLPISEHNGMPIPFTYRARSASEIERHFANNNQEAQFINVIMAQPISDVKVPAFCLLLFSSNNKYTSAHVYKRWEYMTHQLEERGIKVIAIGSDSDPKYNSAMRCASKIGEISAYFPEHNWFSCGVDDISKRRPLYIQDTIHIGTKLRNFLLKTIYNPKLLPFGKKYYVQQQHLAYILKNFTKDKHNLTATIVFPIDRQNFEESVLRITDPKVIDLLKSSVVGSQATVKFLEISRAVIDAYTNADLSAIERIEKIWYAVLIIRFWRQYVHSTKGLTLKNNFLSSYCYSCIELNAHALVLMTLHLSEIKQPHQFMPCLLGSQPCELLFSQARSFTSTYSTVVNCSVKEFIRRISKMQLQNDISYSLSSEYEFPRIGNIRRSATTSDGLPTLQQIIGCIENCRKNASIDAVQLGLIEQERLESFDYRCKIPPHMLPPLSELDSSEKQKEESAFFNFTWSGVLLKNFASKFNDVSVPEHSAYVELEHPKKKIIVKKSSLCWLLRRDTSRLSSDRLARVQQTGKYSKKVYQRNDKISRCTSNRRPCAKKNINERNNRIQLK